MEIGNKKKVNVYLTKYIDPKLIRLKSKINDKKQDLDTF